jgi:autotransporter-associated beta strand protein
LLTAAHLTDTATFAFVTGNGTGFQPAFTPSVAKVGNSLVLTVFAPTVFWTGTAAANASVNGAWVNNDSGNWTSNEVTFPPTPFINGENVVFDDDGFASTIVVDPAGVAQSSMTFNNSATPYTIGGGPIGGSGGISIINNGIVTLTGNNTFTGAASISNGGTLSISSDANLGTAPLVPTPMITLTTGGILQFTAVQGYGNSSINLNRTIVLVGNGTINVGATGNTTNGVFATGEGSVQIPGLITGNGNLTVLGTGATNTGAAPNIVELGGGEAQGGTVYNTYTGSTTINNATVASTNAFNGASFNLSATNMLPSTTVLTLVNNGWLVMNSGNSFQTLAGLVCADGTGVVTTPNNTSTTALTIAPGAGQTYSYNGLIGSSIAILGKTGTVAMTVTIAGNSTGTQVFAGPNTYTGNTTITGGTLRANNGTNGSATGTGAIFVSGNGTLGTLGGNGTVSGAVTINSGGTIAAGADVNTIGNFSMGGGLTMNGNSTYAWKLSTTLGTGNVTRGTGDSGTLGDPGSGIEGTNWDLLTITAGGINLGNLTSTAGNQGIIAPVGNITSSGKTYSWVIAQSVGSGSITGVPTATDLTNGGSGGVFALNTSSFTDASNPVPPSAFTLEAVNIGSNEDLVLDYQFTGTPEPGTMMLVLAGAMPMLAARRRRRQKPTPQA